MRQTIKSRHVVALLLFGTLFYSAVPAESVPMNDRTLPFVRDFLLAAYPNLAGKDLFLKISTGQSIDNAWRELHQIEFIITPSAHVNSNPPRDAATGKPVPVPENSPIIGGVFHFNSRDEIEEVATGEFDFVNWSRNRAMEKLFESHPEWTDAEDYR